MLPHWLDSTLLNAVDGLMARLPAPMPNREQLARARIVSHRGERDDRTVFENTFAAFDPLRGSGVWALEFDLRWTADREPVVYHDADLQRLHGNAARIDALSLAELQALHPEIPTLDAFVSRYADEFHLMVELKPEPYPEPAAQAERLLQALAPCRERHGYHVLCLDTGLLRCLPQIPAARTVGVARFNVEAISREAVEAGRAGIGAQYLLLRESQRRRQHAAGQKLGVGFPQSEAVLRRQLARGIDWIFSNRALHMQQVLDSLRAGLG